jgi:hypothetical protein
MTDTRNPFRLQSTESIDSNATFLRLFGPGMLDLLPADELWNKPRIIRSAPGGGKTTLLRLLTPASLNALYLLRKQDDVRELWERLARFGVVSEAGPDLLGVYLAFNRAYANLDDEDSTIALRDRLLFGLLNARIVIALLRAAVELRQLDFPDDLDSVVVERANLSTLPAHVPVRGADLYQWAVTKEEAICDAIDAFTESGETVLPGDTSPFAQELLAPGALLVGGKPVSLRSVLLLDDLQYLTKRQRTLLVQTFVNSRARVPIWLAERFEALTPAEMFESGAIEGRDYERELLIERFWRRYPKRFEALITNVGDRRAKLASDVEITSFAACLQPRLEGAQWTAKFEAILPNIEQATRQLTRKSPIFDEWFDECSKRTSSPHEEVLKWRTLEILIHRQQAKRQQSFNFPLSLDELNARDDSDTRSAAELFLAREHGLPYYFGVSRMATLASCNVEQFLKVAASEFEEVIASSILRKPLLLTASRQDAIARNISKTVWSEIPRRVARHGEMVKRLLSSIAAFSAEQTYRLNAPYSPGVSGVAISMSDREMLMNDSTLARNPQFRMLADVLAGSIAQNFLEPVPDYKVKGGTWMVLYLNRVLCPHYSLPLGYGGFREKKLSELYQWMMVGHQAQRKLVTQ